jgi:hypothetical protein
MHPFNGTKTESIRANGHHLIPTPESTQYLVSCSDCGHVYGEYDGSGEIPGEYTDCPSLLTDRTDALGDMTGDRG